jgi:selenocysteine lyase/cysteine desulfurase
MPRSSRLTDPLPAAADYIAWSGHKLYPPYGAGVLIGPRATFVQGDPFLAGGGAVDLVDLDEVVWTDPTEREEAGSPNVIGAVALHAAMDEIGRLGWDQITGHDDELPDKLRNDLQKVPAVRRAPTLGPSAAGRGLMLSSLRANGFRSRSARRRVSGSASSLAIQSPSSRRSLARSRGVPPKQ